jgi:TPP-dependent pyruvate/acetoin dehydrogenase alpha subunit
MSELQGSHHIAKDDLIGMYRRMLLIRRTEERLGDDWKRGELPGPVHLYIGEEAVAVGVCTNLTDRDWIASTHRGHGHFIGKGGDPRAMIAEVYGRSAGICKGMGGSMHVADFGKGIMGANGIVAGGVGLAVGAALAAQMNDKGSVSVCFFGDGAANQGVLVEALNISALWKLPLILVCENNGFSEFSPTATVTAGVIADRAKPYGVPSSAVDGNDVLAVSEAAHLAIERARNGGGPSFLECRTYRIRGHAEAESTFLPKGYRSDSEISEWKARDPIERFAAYLCRNGLSNEAELSAVATQVQRTVAEAIEFAVNSPWPPVDQAQQFMFA